MCLAIVVQVGLALAPADYIWFNYTQETTVRPFSVDYYEVPLPCQARIGACYYEFTLLPPGWSQQNNKLLMPAASAYKLGTYAIQVGAYEITGEKLNFSLILDINLGKVKTYDRAEFLGQNGYTVPTTTLPWTLPKAIPTIGALPNFPNTTKVQQTVDSGDIYAISALVSDVIQRNETCTNKLGYLNGVLSIFNSKVKQIDTNISLIAGEINTANQRLQDLQTKKEMTVTQLNSDSEFKTIQSQIAELDANRTESFRAYNWYMTIAGVFLAEIQK